MSRKKDSVIIANESASQKPQGIVSMTGGFGPSSMHLRLATVFSLVALALTGPCTASLQGADAGFDPETALKAAIAKERAKPTEDLGRFFLKEIMRDGDTPSLALVLDLRTMKESFYLTGSFVGSFVIDRVMSESIILRSPESGDLYYLKMNTRGMEKIKTIASEGETVPDNSAATAAPEAGPPPTAVEAADDFDPLGDFDSLNLAGKSQKTIRKKLRALRSGAYVKGESDGSEESGPETPETGETASVGETAGGGETLGEGDGTTAGLEPKTLDGVDRKGKVSGGNESRPSPAKSPTGKTKAPDSGDADIMDFDLD